MKNEMSYQALAISSCNCPNQHLLSPGQTCENCMGLAGFDPSLDQILPDEQFDEAYFEALESYLCEKTEKEAA